MNIIILIGSPFSGKTTQGQIIANQLSYTFMGIGNIIRNEIKESTSIGNKSAKYLKEGVLIPNKLSKQLVLRFIDKNSKRRGFVIDGYPRNLENLSTLFEIINEFEFKFNTSLNVHCFHLDLPNKILDKRINERLTKKGSQAIRMDDSKDVIKSRLRTFEDKTIPLIKKLRDKYNFTTIQAENPVNEVTNQILSNYRVLNNHNTKTTETVISKLKTVQNDIVSTRNLINDLCELFFTSIQDKNPNRNYVPILVLRGGLLCFNAAAKVFDQPIGLILPTKNKSIAFNNFFADIPTVNKKETYLIIDTICNSGSTLIDCLKSLSDNNINTNNCELCFVFGSEKGSNKIIKEYNNMRIHFLKNDYVRGPNGFLLGIDYDAGQYAVNQKKGSRIVI